MKKTLFILLIGACIASCTRTNKQTYNVPLDKYIDLEQIANLCIPDTTHKKALVFCSPYCYGCKLRFNEKYKPILDTIDTSQWRIYFIVSVDSVDTLNYDMLMQDCAQIGVDTHHTYIWRQRGYPEDYNQVISLFHTTYPLENTMSGVPRVLLLDERNYIASIKTYPYESYFSGDKDTFWYEPREFGDFGWETLNDFQTGDTCCQIVRNVQ